MSFTFLKMISLSSSVSSSSSPSSLYRYKTLLIIIGLQLYGIGIINAASIPSKTPLAIRIQQCREGCLEKFATQETLCPNRPECATCWEECAKPPPTKLTKTIQETWSLRTVAMLQQDSLVLVDVSWDPQLNTPNQCLVTWEVSGGGLMGNLLTETYSVQLSLWPDTKYRVQVTCKNKNTGSMSRSLPLNIDTSEAITTHIPIKSTVKPIAAIQSTIKQQQQKIEISKTTTTTTTQSSLMANLPFATSSSSASIPISAPIPTFMDHPLSSFEDDNNDDDIDINLDDQLQQQQQSNELSQSRTKITIKHQNNNNNNNINRKHTNYVFDWHHGKSINTNIDNNNNNNLDETDVQVDKLIPLNQSSDLNIITIETLSDIQKPLLFGILAGILLLTFVLAMYICALRSQRVPSDKTALIDDDGCNSLDNHNISPTTTTTKTSTTSKNFYNNKSCSNNTYYDGNDIINNTLINNTSSDLPSTCNTTNHFGSGPSNILNPNFYSRSVHVLTV